MPINRDPDEITPLDPEQLKEAAQFGLRPIHVICGDPSDPGYVAFFAYVHFVPRAGELIDLDGGVCRVASISYKVPKHPGGHIQFIPNVYAIRVGKGQEEV